MPFFIFLVKSNIFWCPLVFAKCSFISLWQNGLAYQKSINVSWNSKSVMVITFFFEYIYIYKYIYIKSTFSGFFEFIDISQLTVTLFYSGKQLEWWPVQDSNREGKSESQTRKNHKVERRHQRVLLERYLQQHDQRYRRSGVPGWCEQEQETVCVWLGHVQEFVSVERYWEPCGWGWRWLFHWSIVTLSFQSV